MRSVGMFVAPACMLFLMKLLLSPYLTEIPIANSCELYTVLLEKLFRFHMLKGTNEIINNLICYLLPYILSDTAQLQL